MGARGAIWAHIQINGGDQISNGILADVAPTTVLKLIGIKQPKEMTGKALI